MRDVLVRPAHQSQHMTEMSSFWRVAPSRVLRKPAGGAVRIPYLGGTLAQRDGGVCLCSAGERVNRPFSAALKKWRSYLQPQMLELCVVRATRERLCIQLS